MPALWISRARIIDPASRRDSAGDLFVRDGRITPSLSGADRKRAKKIDGRGLVAAPGLVEIHVHFREPGQSHKETIATGSRAPAGGGFTPVVCMPNTTPPADNAGTIQYILDARSEEHTSELQSPCNLVCRLVFEKLPTDEEELAVFEQSLTGRRMRLVFHAC